MKSKEKLEIIDEDIEKSAQEYFKPKPKDIQEELDKETTLGTPNSLAEPCDTDES